MFSGAYPAPLSHFRRNHFMKKKIIAALSGGVDSATTALLLLNAGYDVSALTLSLCDGNEKELSDARALCEKLNIPHTIAEEKLLFRETVIYDFAKSYAAGETPNPCTLCNPKIKFRLLCDFAKQNGAELVATGHYAICEYSEKYGKKVIKKAKNLKKDQSYVLWGLQREQIDMTIFPLGLFDKEDTRAIAAQNGFPNAKKKDSQDICFVKDGKYHTVVQEVLGKTFPEGDFVTPDGTVLGRHKGIINYTNGQRKGLGLSLPAPLYVLSKDVAQNRVVLAPESEIFSGAALCRDANFQAISAEDLPLRAFVRVRYSASDVPCEISLCDGGIKAVFDTPQRAVTPGQSAVFYDGDGVLLGGAVIEKIIK